MADLKTNMRFDRLITIEQPSAATNDYHNETLTWSTLAQVWAHQEYVNSVTDGENMQADKKTATTKIKFTIRYRSDVTKKMRIAYDSVTYDITTTAEIGRRKYLEIECKRYE